MLIYSTVTDFARFLGLSISQLFSLAAENVSRCRAFLPQCHVVFDDIVMNHGKSPVTAHMRMDITYYRLIYASRSGPTDT